MDVNILIEIQVRTSVSIAVRIELKIGLVFEYAQVCYQKLQMLSLLLHELSNPMRLRKYHTSNLDEYKALFRYRPRQ